MFRKRRNVYYHVLSQEKDAKDLRFAKTAVYGGMPMAMAALVGALAAMQPKQETEHGFVPLEQAVESLNNCDPRTEDINGNGKLETVCDDAEGRHYEVRYGPGGEIMLDLYACDVDLAKPYKGQECGE